MKKITALTQVIKSKWSQVCREQRLTVRVVPDKTKYCRRAKHKQSYD